jgi:phosphoenolpyruvate carboxykinase (ATP)
MPTLSKNGFPANALVHEAIQNGEGHLNKHGVLCTYTGNHTGRSPNAKYFVKDRITASRVDWNNNQEISLLDFEEQEKRFDSFLDGRMVYTQNVTAVRNDALSTKIKVTTEFAKHSLFTRNMLIPSMDQEFKPEWNVYHLPSLDNNPQVLISFEKKKILISGTLYAGEIKKSVFTILNLSFLEHGLPMHCSVNVDKDRKNPAIFFGLSGTGKTTLSADKNRVLIGDDEHGWSDEGLTNFEGGCYAKTINLSSINEPQIWEASHKPGAMLENVVHLETAGKDIVPDFDDAKLTQNSRSSYPTSFIEGADKQGYVSEQPKNVIMLTCDAFGVLPAVMKLSSEESVKQFLLGYTAKVAGTEAGVTEPKATFSPCFGLPFMPCHPSVYGRKLKTLVEKSGADCWLVNTGWSGGSYGTGERMPIKVTRHIVDLILDGSLSDAETEIHLSTGFTVPKHSGIERKYLHPEESWSNINDYKEKLGILLNKFAEAESSLED